MPKFFKLSFRLAGPLSPSSTPPGGGLVVLLAMLVDAAPGPPRWGEPKRSTPCLAASIKAVPKFVGSKRAGSEGVECEAAVSFKAASPDVAAEGGAARFNAEI